MSIGDGFKFGFGFTIGAAVASLVAWIPFVVLWGVFFASAR